MFKTMIVKSIGGGIALAILLLSSTGLKAAVTHSVHIAPKGYQV